MLRLTLATLALAALLVWMQRLSFDAAGAAAPAGICILLAAVAVFYQRFRPVPGFVLCAKALLVLVAFSSAYSTLMYALATTARPLADPTLAACDASVGLSAGAVVSWVQARPWVERSLWIVYFSLIPQTILAIVWLGLGEHRASLDRFLIRFMLAGLITAVGFYLCPAIGSCASFDVRVPPHYVGVVDHLESLRSGQRTHLSLSNVEGLITFPSFHATWAVLLTAAFYGRGRVFYPIALLNVAVIASTVTTGMHYFTDVLGGLTVSAIVLVAYKDGGKEELATEITEATEKRRVG